MIFLILTLLVLALGMIVVFPQLYANILTKIVKSKNEIKQINKENH